MLFSQKNLKTVLRMGSIFETTSSSSTNKLLEKVGLSELLTNIERRKYTFLKARIVNRAGICLKRNFFEKASLSGNMQRIKCIKITGPCNYFSVMIITNSCVHFCLIK